MIFGLSQYQSTMDVITHHSWSLGSNFIAINSNHIAAANTAIIGNDVLVVPMF